MSSTPNYAAAPRASSAIVSTANAALDGTGTITSIFAAGGSGSRVDLVVVQATVSTTAGMVRLWLHDGTNSRLIQEIQIPAVTVGPSVPAFNASVTFDGGLVLPSGFSLRASTNNAEAFHVSAFGGDF